jgi:glycosyltransferase involved in cell wall biosynthesis
MGYLSSFMSVSVIVSTYNSPAWLQKVGWGFAAQTTRDFEMVIAGDGSTDETRKMVESMVGQNLQIRKETAQKQATRCLLGINQWM